MVQASLQIATLGVLAAALFWLGSRLGSRIDRLVERFGEVAERLAGVETRLDGIAGTLEHMDQRITALERVAG